jgi:hypothetical protein
MKRDIAKKWVAALRSGRYEQTKDWLYDGRGYCCLGVLAKELGFEFKPGRSGVWKCEGQAEDLPREVMKGAGMRSVSGKYHNDSEFSSLSYENDSGATFLEIADIIESRQEDL